MASSTPLSLFPSAHSSQPRKSSLKKAKPHEAPGELKAVAVKISSKPSAQALMPEPANEHIKHSLFCDTSHPDQASPGWNAPRRHISTQSLSSKPTGMTSVHKSTTNSPSNVNRPPPSNQNAGSSKPTKPQLQRPKMPSSITTDPDMLTSPGGDTVSPLPNKQLFSNVSPGTYEYPTPQSLHSAGPTLVRSNSNATTAPPYSPPAMKSIFPQYDHSMPLRDQEYYPTARSPTPILPNEKVSKLGSPVQQMQTLKRLDSSVALVEDYEHIPSATEEDLLAIWNASCGTFPVHGRKARLGLIQPRGEGTSLAIGSSQNRILYSMDKDSMTALPEKSTTSKQIVVKKCPPQHKDESLSQVALMALPETGKAAKEHESELVSIFPQMAAVNAIEAIANSPIAASIASFDPKATSPEAAKLAQDAVADAQNKYRCKLLRSMRKRDSLGAVTGAYRLEHPSLGTFPITITKSTFGRHARDPRAKISLHHPSATPAAVAAETLVLAFLDFARDACVLDVPGLLALESSYVIDTVVCALLAVAVIENDALMAETMTFEAPPKQRTRSPGKRSSRRSSRLFKRDKKKMDECEEEQVELPMLTQGALAMLGFSFKATVWALGVGVKATAAAVVGISHLATKGK